jgi:predicted peptidase
MPYDAGYWIYRRSQRELQKNEDIVELFKQFKELNAKEEKTDQEIKYLLFLNNFLSCGE